MSTVLDHTQTDNVVRGERVAALLWARGVTRRELANRCEINNTALSAKLHGRRRWYLNEVASIAEALDTTVGYLIGEEDDPKPGPPNSDAIEWAEFQLWRARRDSNSQPSDP